MSENRDIGMDDFDDSPRPKKSPRPWIVWCSGVGILVLLVCLLLPAGRSARPAARRSQCTNNLKQIAMALQGYEAVYHALPPAYTIDAHGKPLHSWRTLILPYLEGYQHLYEKIDLSRAWDDPANAEAYDARPTVYQCPSAVGTKNYTTYLASVASNGCFRPTEPRRLSAITDGLASTLMVIEVPPEQSVHWMSPRDADQQLVMGFGPKSKLAHDGGVNAAFCDGRVLFLPAKMTAAERRAMISIAEGDN